MHKSSRHQYFYDKLGNLIREYRHDSLDGTARSHVWHHRYDALGNRTETIRPDGQRIGYLHYGSGHLHGIIFEKRLLEARNEATTAVRDRYCQRFRRNPRICRRTILQQNRIRPSRLDQTNRRQMEERKTTDLLNILLPGKWRNK